jgi:hypothetical protein
MPWGLLKWVGEKSLTAYLDRRRVRVLVHRGSFIGTGQECFFVNVVNTSRSREVELTHVWFEVAPAVHVLQPDRLPPRRLKPDESWETWVAVDQLPRELGEQVFALARVRLTSGTVLKSKKNPDVPAVGTVPGGPISHT